MERGNADRHRAARLRTCNLAGRGLSEKDNGPVKIWTFARRWKWTMLAVVVFPAALAIAAFGWYLILVR